MSEKFNGGKLQAKKQVYRWVDGQLKTKFAWTDVDISEALDMLVGLVSCVENSEDPYHSTRDFVIRYRAPKAAR